MEEMKVIINLQDRNEKRKDTNQGATQWNT